MKKIPLSWMVIAAALIFQIPLFAKGQGETRPAAQEKHLIVALNPDYISFDPGIAYEPYAGWVISNSYDTLYRYEGSTTNFVPSLAESYSVSADGLTYTYKLKKDIKFNSGNPLTSEDILWSNQRNINLKGNGAFHAKGIVSIEAPDPYTIVYHLKEVDPTFHVKLNRTFFSPLDKKTLLQQGATNAPDASTADKAKIWLDTHSAGTGPYQLQSYIPNNEVVLVRNPNYWRSAPYYDKITLKTIPDPNSQVMALQRGDVDIAFNTGPEQIKSLQGVKNIEIVDAPDFRFNFLLLNRDPAIGGPLANPKVAKAVNLAIDYKGLQTIAGPAFVVLQGPFSIGLPGSLPPRDVSSFPKVEAAKALLKEAGYPNGFSVKFYVPTVNQAGLDFVTLAQKIQNDLAAVGIKTELVPEPSNVSLDSYRNGKQSLALWHWGPDYQDNISNLSFLPGNTVGLRANWKAEANPALADLGKKTSLELDESVRNENYKKIIALLEEDSPFVPLLQHASQYAIRAGLKGADYAIRRVELGRVSE
ncbi:MAG: ABC transporter substrate-binding protein [Treponema sp.]|jgi:peptide/nickel transport system substrate-binding protein|nr:ABC transporter substrate-binding protein [Treponema sp.]